MDTRYQFQPRHVQLYRWWRYRPIQAALAVKDILGWLAFSRKLPDPIPELPAKYQPWQTWGEYIGLMWRLRRSMAEGHMQHYWTMQEVIGRSNEKLKAEGKYRETIPG